ncbi:MAG: LTA synthase family protein [Crocinitomicaceae bacterium]|nr:LTA synthase family protein [Crocinitomicaceae bacterium]
MLLITRVLFYFSNSNSFSEVGFMDFFWGAWFDIITISLYFFGYVGLYMLPIPLRHQAWYRILFKVGFLALAGFMLFLNLIDISYFPFTQKRSTADLLGTVSTGDDFGQLIGTFLAENWYLLLLFIVLIFLLERLYRLSKDSKEKSTLSTLQFQKVNWIWFLLIVPLMIFLGRGGTRPVPIGILDATAFTSSQNTALVLNTPFTFIKTIAVEGIEQKNYFSIEEEKKYFDPIHTSQPANILPDSTNVVILVLESFGKEFVGILSGEESYAPYLDSMISESMYFEYAFANGKKSNESIPAILASIPSLTANPYSSSQYGDNDIHALPSILKENGYSTAFYHGASNGSMLFDSFSKRAGMEFYFGRNEYGNDDHFDGHWAISDGYFNPWSAKKMSELKPPFCSLLFNTSSHHPYFVPKKFRKFTKKGPQEICAAISYSDYALRLFFDEAKKQDWYENTLFVFVADHSPASYTSQYNLRNEMYRIPLAFYHPKGLIKPEKRSEIAQQLDVFPTILDLLNVKSTYYSYGSSLLQGTEKYGITHLEGSYYYFNGEQMMIFSKDQAQNLLNFTKGSVVTENELPNYKDVIKERENRLKAILQRYSRDLVSNQTRVK